MARLKTWLAVLMAAMLLLTAFPVYADEPDAGPDDSQNVQTLDAPGADQAPAYVRIKNKWQSNYLYEASDGKVRYGLTSPMDESSQWTVETVAGESYSRIKNRLTGHYITIEDVKKRKDALTSKEIADASTMNDKWYIVDSSRVGYSVIKSATVATSVDLVIHEEDQLGFAEASSDINIGFESPQWAFEPVPDMQPFRLANRQRLGQYLFESSNPDGGRPNNAVQSGAVSPQDLSSQWYMEPGDNGTVKLRNVATGNYIAQLDNTEGNEIWHPVETRASADNPLAIEWTETGTSGGYVTLTSALDSNPIHTQSGDVYARANDWSNGAGQELFKQWRIEYVSGSKPVRIVNFTIGSVGTDFLYEADGVVKHGLIAGHEDDAAYFWTVEDFDGAKRIRNVGTGEYVKPGSPLQLTDGAGNAADTAWSFKASDNFDDYFSIESRANPGTYLNNEGNDGNAQSGEAEQGSESALWLLDDPTLPPDGYVRIQNNWQPFVLYEDEHGELKYGNVRSDYRDQWKTERFNGRKRIQNRATGHYINLQAGKNGHIQVSDVQDDWTSAVWIIESAGGDSKIIHSVNDPKSGTDVQPLINLQNLTKYAEYSSINKGWGSPQWTFIPVVSDDGPKNVRFINKDGKALYEEVTGDEGGLVKYGDKSASDPATVWTEEDAGGGVIRLKNLASGNYLSLQHLAGHESEADPTDPLQTIKTIYDSWASVKWRIVTTQASGYSAIQSAWTEHIVATDGDGGTKVGKSVKDDSGHYADSALFRVDLYTGVTPDLPTTPIRIRNAYNNQYLYENSGGAVLYGDVDESNGYSHWLLETNNGVTRLKNRVTGHYMTTNDDYSYIGTVASDADGTDYPGTGWAIEYNGGGTAELFRSLNEPFNDEYMNVQNAGGYAERGLYPTSFGSLQWKLDTAPNDFVATPVDGERNEKTGTPIQNDTNYIKIGAEGRYLVETNGAVSLAAASEASEASALWLVQDYNGRKLFKNGSSGHLLKAGEAGALTAVGSSPFGDDGVQWYIDDSLGYKLVRNAASAAGALLAHEDGQAAVDASAAADDARWSFEPVPLDIVYQAEDAFQGSGAKTSSDVPGYTGEGYVDGFTAVGAKASFAVNAQQADSYQAKFRYLNAGDGSRTLSLYVNGIFYQKITFSKSIGWAEQLVSIPLRAGINSVAVQYDTGDQGRIGLDALTIESSVNKIYRGATVPYTTYEAEQGKTTGTVLDPTRIYREIASEASGRQAVKLDQTGQYVEFKTAKQANSLVLRYSIPDSDDGDDGAGQNATLGLYVNGQLRQKLALTSKYAWEYGSYPWSNDPNQGSAHRFFDEIHVLTGDIPEGATVRLMKDGDSTASSYIIDLVDLEQVADPYQMPAGFVSVLDYGAKANDGHDDSQALAAAIAAAKAAHKGVWFPQGEFDLSNGTVEQQLISLDDITIRGAGMWYTTLKGAKFLGQGANIQVYDLLIDGGINERDDEAITNAFHGVFGPGSVIQDVWIEHTKVGLWLTQLKEGLDSNNPFVEGTTDGLYMLGLRIRDLMADGINFSVGTKGSMMEQSDIRYPGDDGIAMWSAEGKASVGNTARFNTVSLPWLADNIVVFGGTSNRIQDNIAKDTITSGAGIAVSTRFSPVPFDGTTIVERNTMIRTGSYDTGYQTELGALWVFADDKDIDGHVVIRNNVALDSTYLGVSIQGRHNLSNVSLQDLVIDGAGTKGVRVVKGLSEDKYLTGSIGLDNVIVRDAKIAPIAAAPSGFGYISLNEGYANEVKPFMVEASDGSTGRFTVKNGGALQLRVKNLAGVDVTENASFSVSSSAVADIAADGRVVSHQPGVIRVSVAYGGNTREYTLTVSAGTDPQPKPPSGGTSGSVEQAADNDAAANDGKLAEAKDGTITFSIGADNPAGEVPFTVQGIKDAAVANPNATLVIRSGDAAYLFPLSLVGKLLEGQTIADASKAQWVFTVKPLDDTAAAKYESDAAAQGLKLAGNPVEFGIALKIGDQTVPIRSFGSVYVARTITVDSELDPNTATALVYDATTGQFVYVPATFAVADGKTIATIKSTGNSLYALAAHSATYDDIASHWAKADIEKLASKLIVKGVTATEFAPSRSITRAEFAALLVRALGLRDQGEGKGKTFADVADGAWYAKDVAIASQFGLVTGMTDGTFHPGDSITREQMAVMIAKAYALAAGDTSAAAAAVSFKDAGAIHAWAKDAVALAVEQGILQGTPAGEFAPLANATRAEAAAIIGRALKAAQLMN